MTKTMKTLAALAIATATLTVTTLVASDGASAFVNTIHPIRSPVVRDHRGPNGASQGGVTATGNPVVRDHRNRNPNGNPKGGSPIVRDHRPIPCLGNLC
jgi:hypothetical protein